MTFDELLAQHEAEHAQALANARAKAEKWGQTRSPEADADRAAYFKLKQSASTNGLCQQIMEASRLRAHQARKAKQPALTLNTHNVPNGDAPTPLVTLVTHFRRPPEPQEIEDRLMGLDAHLRTLQELLDAGDLEDALHEALEICRKQWFANMLQTDGDIDPARRPKQ